MAQLNVQDPGTAHSPIYGYVVDGYPIYGPWYANGVLAQSCWKKRDYAAGSPTGCGVAGARTCLLADQYDTTKGTIPAPDAGPNTGGTVPSPASGNVISTNSGLFLQDYYWDQTCTAQGGPALDQYNGHSHDNLGYHYHITRTVDASGNFTEAFPYLVGPTLYGAVADMSDQCAGSQ
jgi:hypothetical protein